MYCNHACLDSFVVGGQNVDKILIFVHEQNKKDMATITLSLSDRINEYGKSEIMIRFSSSQAQRYRIKSGLFISVKRWTKKNGISIPKMETKEREELIFINDRLNELKKTIFAQFEKSDKETISKEWLLLCVDKFHFPEKHIAAKLSFFGTFDEFIAKKKLSEVRVRNFKVVFRSLQRYELFKRFSGDELFMLSFENFTKDTLIELEGFFKTEHKVFEKFPEIYKLIKESREPKPRGQNTINDMFVKIRTFFIWSVDNEKTSNNPFKNFSIEECIYGTPYYISIEERNQLYTQDFSKRAATGVQRDIFVFHCLVGCRVGDLYKLTQKNVINGVIEYIARKTIDGNPVTVRVPLNSLALEILEKYKDENRVALLPFISEQKYNVQIKAAFKLAGLTRMVTVVNPTTREEEKQPLNKIASSHLARRCFVGNLYKQVKDQNLVASLSGHKEGSKAFARYREIDDQMKTDLVNLLL